jgi:glycine hydroxymethyltransferase
MRKDAVLEKFMKTELLRQKATINLIPSENYVSDEMLSVIGSVLTNKYSEGYAGKRYYPGNAIYDSIEKLAQVRIRKLFKLGKDWHINVQPHSGSSANMAVYLALMQPTETFVAMGLAQGGHLSHGHRVSATGRLFRAAHYGLDADGVLDYDEASRLVEMHKAKIVVSGATSYPRTIDFARFGTIAKKTGTYHMADISHIAGLVATGLHPSPFPHADVVTSTTHKTLRGPRGAFIACRADFADRIDRVVFPGLQGGPHNHITAAIARMGFEALEPSFKKYQTQIIKNTQALAKALTLHGFMLVSGGTDNHLMLIDCKGTGMTGMEAQNALEAAGITANRNSIAGDQSPFYPTGIRLGTPAVTTRGMKERDMAIIAAWIARLLLKKEKPVKIKKEVATFTAKFPLYAP